MHASTIIIGNKGVLIRGKAGAGKSSLALHLIESSHAVCRFAGLVSDDQTKVNNANGLLLASCPDAIAGKIEIRGFGIVDLDCISSAIIHLVVDLVEPDRIERMPDLELCEIERVKLPHISVPRCREDQATRIILARLTFETHDHS
jgi:serine kinase of HPr protein (carbohydrate metabolism regulator)